MRCEKQIHRSVICFLSRACGHSKTQYRYTRGGAVTLTKHSGNQYTDVADVQRSMWLTVTVKGIVVVVASLSRGLCPSRSLTDSSYCPPKSVPSGQEWWMALFDLCRCVFGQGLGFVMCIIKLGSHSLFSFSLLCLTAVRLLLQTPCFLLHLQ